MIDTNRGNTCRFCRSWEGVKIQYGARHWAHLACLHSRGRLKETLATFPTWALNQLPFMQLQDAGLLDYVRDMVAKRESESDACTCKRNDGTHHPDCDLWDAKAGETEEAHA